MRVPPAIIDACRTLLDEWGVALRKTPDAHLVRRRRVTHAVVPSLSAAITMVGQGLPTLAEPSFVVELRRTGPDSPGSAALPVLRNVTAAERDVALAVTEGLSNQEIADRLGKTVHAVKFLLHRIYQKAGVPGRARLIALLRGRSLEPS